ncbi:type IV secretion system protein VirD4 [Chitinophaga skermanii]|uniref:Type IV secretion system protein VirD4 n=1 Tax=Chitinophaga skermanii TaxID=331697 RepID=A0A327QP32_9BACT|nr:type IV secretory system conjugative DNA transfer family protein [Chitinophaga skermanii]RAJ05412.1 type IV secretion system protein VirD4 [Chitinophaga skermanii]
MMQNKKYLVRIGILVLAFYLYSTIVSWLTRYDYNGSGGLIYRLIGWGVFLFLLVRFGRKLFKGTTTQGPTRRNTDHGSAHWASFDDFYLANNPNKASAGLVLGVAGLVRPKQGHLITVAGTGSGKGACLIIPTLLNEPTGSFVVTDPKGENACITARSQVQYGQNVYILDPWGEQQRIGARHGIEAAGFNPFDFIKMNVEELRDNCEQVANLLVPDRPGDKDPYWNDRSRTLIKTLMMHIITWLPPDEHNFWTLYKMLRYSAKDWTALLLEMGDNPADDGIISIASQEFLGLEEAGGSTMASIRSTAQTATSIFESPQLRRSLETSDFNPFDLTDGKTTVYIVIPERYLETHSTWLRMVIGLCLSACNAKPNKRVTYMLDEFAVMGKMKDVQKAFAFARGQNIVMWFFAQNLSQIKEIYGEDGMNTFIGNAALLLCFGGMKDQYTTQYFSKAYGKTTASKLVRTHGHTSSRDSSSTTTSNSWQTYEKDLVSPDEIEAAKEVIFYIGEGHRFVHKKQPWFRNMFEGISHDHPELTKENAKIIKSGNLPQDGWHEYYIKQADPAPRVYE